MFGLSKDLKDFEHPNKKKAAEELSYFTSRLPFTAQKTGCAIDSANGLDSPLKTAAACHLTLSRPHIRAEAKKLPKASSWIGMKM
mmetsp:Transcript_47014/g.73584  ORF Transcript_47014/g.73584 Transcript_47014/m.73584 type:complete len:85 (-) Transcript_47014:1863-2117(-)